MEPDGDGISHLDGPGAAKCNFNDSYVMGADAVSPNQFIWSQCSVDQLRWFSLYVSYILPLI